MKSIGIILQINPAGVRTAGGKTPSIKACDARDIRLCGERRETAARVVPHRFPPRACGNRNEDRSCGRRESPGCGGGFYLWIPANERLTIFQRAGPPRAAGERA